MCAALFRTRTTFVLLPIVATMVSWAFGQRRLHRSPARGAGGVDTAFVKVRFVLLDFMELRHAPRAMRLAVEAWTVVVCSALCSLYG